MLATRGAIITIRVFVASPGDVALERDIVERVVRDVDQTLVAYQHPVRMELRRWERDTFPSAGSPQSVINRQIGTYDVFVGVMWRRFGTRTERADSGTEEEYLRAYARWKRRRRPQMMFYFSLVPAPPPQSVAEAKQLLQVARFRERIEEEQLIAQYESRDDFELKFRRHLTAVSAKFIPTLAPGRVHPPKKKVNDTAQELSSAVDARQNRRRQKDNVVEKAKRELRAAIPAPRNGGRTNGRPRRPSTRIARKEVAAVVKKVTRTVRQWKEEDSEWPSKPSPNRRRRRN